MDVVITKIGLEKIANATVDSPLNITQFAVGDGNNAPITPNENMTALVNEKYRDFINGMYANENSITVECTLRAEANIQEGFKIFEIGIFDYEGDLIAISQTPEQYRPAKSEGIATELIASIVLKLSNTANITVEIPETVFATTEALTRETENRISDFDNLLQKIQNLENSLSKRIGTMFASSGSEAPEGSLICNGSFLKITEYQELFKIIGHKYNSGIDPKDGTFKIPDHTGRYSRGASSTLPVGSYQDDSIKNHSHSINVPPLTLPRIQGAVSTGGEYGFDAFSEQENNTLGAFSIGGKQNYRARTFEDNISGASNTLFFDSYKGGATYTGSWTGNTETIGELETRPKTVIDLWCIWYK